MILRSVHGCATTRWLLALALSVSAPCAPLAAAALAEDDALAASQGAVGRTLSAHVLSDRSARPVALDSLRGRPLVVSLVYTSCYGSCNVVSRRLAQAVQVAREALGRDSFRVITVGFDAVNDTPERMAAFAKKQRIGDAGWLVLSADEPTARALGRELGFSYVTSPRGFDHISQVSILDADGRVFRQVYGDGFATPALVEPLKELVWGSASRAATLDGWISGLKLLCTVYDPAADRYRFDYSVFVAAVIGVLCLGGVAVFVVRSWNAGGERHAS